MELSLENLTSPEVEEKIQDGMDTAVFPIGAIEQHGGHGPLGTDGYISRAIAQGVATKIKAFCLPPLWYGVSAHHMHFAGSLTIRPKVLADLVEDILESLIHHGIRKILIISGHGGNNPAIHSGCTTVRYRHPEAFLVTSSAWLALRDIYESLPPHIRQENWRTMIAHGGLFETSVVMAVKDGIVKMDRAVAVSVDKYVQATDPAMSLTFLATELSECGSTGDPLGSGPELGKMFLEESVSIIAAKFFKALKVFGRDLTGPDRSI